MTSMSVQVRALNSLLFVRDPTIKDLPEIDGESSVWWTPTCVALSCLPDSDGETEISLGVAQDVVPTSSVLFDGDLWTPSRRIIVETVLGQVILEMRVPSRESRIRIWTNGQRDTNIVVVGVG